MSARIYSFVAFILIFAYELRVAGYRSDIPTFQVGPHMSGKNAPYCPCEEVNSTFFRSCGVVPKVSSVNIPMNGTHFGEFPWQVAITEKYEEEFLCSGVLISPRIVLTAARCIQDIPTTHIRVRLGEWDILSEDKNPLETYRSVEITVSKKYLNPDSSVTSNVRGPNEEYNLGILKMAIPVNFDEYPHVAPVCLPVIMNNKANLSDCMVAGWSVSTVKPLNEFMEVYVDDLTAPSKGMQSVLVSSTCSGNDCHVRSTNQQENAERTAAPLEIMLKEVDGITAQIKGALEESIGGVEEMSNSKENYAGKYEVYSRILQKSAARVLNRSECSKTLKDLNATILKPTQMCVAANEGSKPCVGDIGSPVICKIVEDKKRNWKETKVPEDYASKFAVVGIITQSYSCSEDEAGSINYPILATSISKSLDHICYVMASASKDSKTSFKVVH